MLHRLAILSCLTAALVTAAPGEMPRRAPAQAPLAWSSRPGRNLAFDVSGLPEAVNDENLLWKKDLRATQYTHPTVAGDKLLLGTSGSALQGERLKPGGKPKNYGALMCMDLHTGKLIWQLRTPPRNKNSRDSWYGMCSSPVVRGDRLWAVSSQAELLCLDLNGQADGNDGPFKDEAAYMTGQKDDALGGLEATDADILWLYDLDEQLNVKLHDAYSGTPLLLGDQLWISTSHAEGKYKSPTWRPNYYKHGDRPKAPNLAVFDAESGKLLAHDDLTIPTVYHGQWSTPTAGRVEGKWQVFWGDGYGVLHAFDASQVAGDSDKPVILKEAWRFDCNPRQYREKPDGSGYGYDHHSAKGPSEIIATPVFRNGLVYIAIGRDFMYNDRKSQKGRSVGDGMLWCLDPAAEASDRVVWSTDKVHRTLSTVAISGDLLVAADTAGYLHAFSASTGEHHWTFDMEYQIWASSPIIADGKIYVSTDHRDLFTLRASPEKQLLATSQVDSMQATPAVAPGLLILPSQRSIRVHAGAGYTKP
jgi:outer membrane protein assembly factor BamB